MAEASNEREMIALRDRAARFGAVPRMMRMNDPGSVRMALLDYRDFAGEQQQAGYILFNLCTRNAGAFARQSGEIRVDGVMRPGTLSVTLPDDGARVRWSRMQMLGIGFDPAALADRFDDGIDPLSLADAAGALHDDPLLTAVMTALWRDGEAHGLSSAFFDHGLALLVGRLQHYRAAPAPAPARRIWPLAGTRLARVLDLIDARLAEDVSVAELAREAGQDIGSFGRSFKAATGLAPFQYLTRRRMERAAEWLGRGESVTAAALAVGYANPSKFAAAFRRVTGALPSDFAKGERERVSIQV